MSEATKFLLLLPLLLLSTLSSCFGSELDIQCLKSVQKSVVDPNGLLKSSWDFEKKDYYGYNHICRDFVGVECWNPGETRILSLHFEALGLEGSFPEGLQHCTTISGLHLSANKFSGQVPSDISLQMPYLTSLDLSYNSFSGEIPYSIANMAYLNVLNLGHNQFSGRIPMQLSMLARLTTLNVAGNLLSGPIPNFAEELNSPLNFAGNQGLCGAPLDDCPLSKRKRIPIRIRLHRINDESSIGAAIGFVAGFVVAFYLPHCFLCTQRLRACVFRM